MPPHSHESPQALEPGKTYTVRIRLDDTAWRVAKGLKLRVSLSTSYWPMIWPAPQPVALQIHTGQSYLDLPVRTARRNEVAPEFPPAECAPEVQQTHTSQPFNQRELTRNQATGEVRLSIVDDYGRSTITAHGLTQWACGRENYSIFPNDPLSAQQECHWTEERSRGEWSMRSETYSKMTASLTHWHITGRLEAYENGKCILVREWDQKIERQLN